MCDLSYDYSRSLPLTITYHDYCILPYIATTAIFTSAIFDAVPISLTLGLFPWLFLSPVPYSIVTWVLASIVVQVISNPMHRQLGFVGLLVQSPEP